MGFVIVVSSGSLLRNPGMRRGASDTPPGVPAAVHGSGGAARNGSHPTSDGTQRTLGEPWRIHVANEQSF